MSPSLQNKDTLIIRARRQLLSGIVSGMVSRTFVAPIERVIIMKQTRNQTYSNHGIVSTIRKMMLDEGILSLFKGNFTNCIRISIFQFIEFFIFHELQSLIPSPSPLLNGAISGMISSTIVYPLDLAKTLIALGKKNNKLRNVLIDIIQQKGLAGLYTGWCATMIGIAPYAGLKFWSYNNIKSLWKYKSNTAQQEAIRDLINGGLAGCFAVTITYPTDLIRRTIHSQINQSPKPKFFQTLNTLINTKGILSLYKGLFTTYVKIIPSTAITFAINESLITRASNIIQH